MAEATTIMGFAVPDKPPGISTALSAGGQGLQTILLTNLTIDVLNETRKLLEPWLELFSSICESAPKKGLKDVYESVLQNVRSEYSRTIDGWIRGLGAQCGSSLVSLFEAYSGYPQLVTMLVNGRLDVALRQRVSRYFNTVYTPTVPNSRLAFQLLSEGQISRAEFSQFCSEEGWPGAYADKLYAVYDRDPDARTAFSWWKRGFLTADEMKQAFRIEGWDASWDETLEKGFSTLPSPMELMRMADFVELPDLWVREKLRANGLTDSDVNYYAGAIEKRPLREEVRGLTAQIVWERQHGRITAEQVTEELNELPILSLEKTLIAQLAERRYAQELVTEGIGSVEARCVGGDATLNSVTAIKNAIIAFGLLEEKANLIAIDFYYRYVFTP